MLHVTQNHIIEANMKKDTHMTIRITDEHGEKLDDLRRQEADVPSRSEMIRRLIERSEIKKKPATSRK